MPHLLVAGATGSGKSVGLQSMITSILYKATREEVQFIFIDPKRIELGVYADIPHLKAEVVVEPKKAANALRWAVAEMERRYRLLAEVHVRSIDFYNRAIRDPEVQQRLSLDGDGESSYRAEDFKPLPYYVIVIDELADLMMVAAAEVETSIARLAQMARAVGIHLIVATQRPSVDVLTGTIKANFPCRISFATAVASRLAHHPRQRGLGEAARQGRHADHAAGDFASDAPARRLHQRAGNGGAGALAQEARPARVSTPRCSRAPGRRAAAPPTAATTTTSCSTKARAWWSPSGMASARFLQRRMRDRLLARRAPHRHDGARRPPRPAAGLQAARRAGQARLLRRDRPSSAGLRRRLTAYAPSVLMRFSKRALSVAFR